MHLKIPKQSVPILMPDGSEMVGQVMINGEVKPGKTFISSYTFLMFFDNFSK